MTANHHRTKHDCQSSERARSRRFTDILVAELPELDSKKLPQQRMHLERSATLCQEPSAMRLFEHGSGLFSEQVPYDHLVQRRR